MSSSKLDDKTSVPIGWLGAAAVAMISAFWFLALGIFHGAMWMKSVDDRLSAIEKQVGVTYEAQRRTPSTEKYE